MLKMISLKQNFHLLEIEIFSTVVSNADLSELTTKAR